MSIQIVQQSLNKFSLSQACSNNDGKTSGSGTLGLYLGFVAGLAFILGVIDRIWITKTSDVINASLTLASVAVALLAARKMKQGASVNEEAAILSNIKKPPGEGGSEETKFPGS